jgi:hypothetical protein
MDEKVRKLKEEWEKEIKEQYEKKLRFPLPEYTNESGIPLKCVYDPEDVEQISPEMPGQYPYT